jgi:hypothetical protein
MARLTEFHRQQGVIGFEDHVRWPWPPNQKNWRRFEPWPATPVSSAWGRGCAVFRPWGEEDWCILGVATMLLACCNWSSSCCNHLSFMLQPLWICFICVLDMLRVSMNVSKLDLNIFDIANINFRCWVWMLETCDVRCCVEGRRCPAVGCWKH